MNRRPPVFKLSKALTGFVQYKQAEGLSPRTIEIYQDHLKKWAAHVGDPPVSKIRAVDIRGYLVWLANDYRPKRFGKLSREPLSPKTVHNVWISLSAFFTWARSSAATTR
jgi:integrase/recombinase XerD